MVLGSSVQLGALIDLSDALVFLVAIPNLIGLYLLAPVVRAELLRYQGLARTSSLRSATTSPPPQRPVDSNVR